MNSLSLSPLRIDTKSPYLWIGFFSLFTLSLFRTAIHVDEARYLTVAWEMYQQENWLVPNLNGVPYSHKPPLLFWLTGLLWKLFGVHLWVARLAPILSLISTTLLLPKLYTLLFQDTKPSNNSIYGTFLSCYAVIALSQLYMFDSLMILWITLGWIALLSKNDTRPLFLGISIGLGILTKGPVILLYLGSAAFLQGYFLPSHGRKKLFRECLFALLIGSSIGLVWAIPAAIKGGDTYATALLWKQSAHRLVNSFHHQRPWWFYLPFLPTLGAPALFFTQWRSFPELIRSSTSFLHLTLWCILIFLLFTLISCKQLQYLAPLIPITTLLLVRIGIPEKTLKYLFWSSYLLFFIIIYPLNEQLEKRLPLQGIFNSLKQTHQQDQPLAFIHTLYHGELGFLLKQETVSHLNEINQIHTWFHRHPKGTAVIFDCPTYFPGEYSFQWFHPIPSWGSWQHLQEKTRFYEDYFVLSRFPGRHNSKIIIQRNPIISNILLTLSGSIPSIFLETTFIKSNSSIFGSTSIL